MLVPCVINACNKIREWGVAVSDVANILSDYYFTIIARLKHHFIACICTYICICTFCIWKPFRSVFPVLQLKLILRRIKLKCRISRLIWKLVSAFSFSHGSSHRKSWVQYGKQKTGYVLILISKWTFFKYLDLFSSENAEIRWVYKVLECL